MQTATASSLPGAALPELSRAGADKIDFSCTLGRPCQIWVSSALGLFPTNHLTLITADKDPTTGKRLDQAPQPSGHVLTVLVLCRGHFDCGQWKLKAGETVYQPGELTKNTQSL